MSGNTLSGTGASGTISVSATLNCGAESISGTIGGLTSGTLTGTAATHTCPDPHDVNNRYAWSLAGTPANGTAFMNFLVKLNDGTSSNGNTISGCFADHCDWRLPTIVELQTILLAPYPCGTDPCINQTIFGPTQSFIYWSSITVATSPSLAWFVGFDGGNVNYNDKPANL